ncbi:DUF3159 domain-containing protein [Actinomycetes bacterium KLBMP 9759]
MPSVRRRRTITGTVLATLDEIDETTWLGIARVATGWPLTLVAALVTIWVVRNVDRRRTQLEAA